MEPRILVTVLALLGCVSQASARSYAERIEGIAYPADEADWKKKCRWLRWEMARQQDIASSGVAQPGTFAFETKAIARDHVSTLASRISDFHCNTSYISSAPSPTGQVHTK